MLSEELKFFLSVFPLLACCSIVIKFGRFTIQKIPSYGYDSMKVLSSYIIPLFIWYQPMFVGSWFLEEPLGLGLEFYLIFCKMKDLLALGPGIIFVYCLLFIVYNFMSVWD